MKQSTKKMIYCGAAVYTLLYIVITISSPTFLQSNVDNVWARHVLKNTIEEIAPQMKESRIINLRRCVYVGESVNDASERPIEEEILRKILQNPERLRASYLGLKDYTIELLLENDIVSETKHSIEITLKNFYSAPMIKGTWGEYDNSTQDSYMFAWDVGWLRRRKSEGDNKLTQMWIWVLEDLKRSL